MKKGFTLIELSIVLIIIGLLTGGAFQMLKVMQEKARATEAKQKLEAAKEAVIAFAINYGHLPTDANFTAMNLKDAGGMDIYYTSDPKLQTTLCDYKTSALSVTDSNNVNIPNIGFVLAIAGENFNVQTGRTTPTDNNIHFYPRDVNSNVDDETSVLNRPEPYDDLYVQVTLGELQSQADCQTTKLKIINTTLPTGTAGISYSVAPAVIASGGKFPYTYQLISNTSTSTFTPSNNTLAWTSPTIGNYLLTFTATDSIGTVSEPKELILTINADPTAGGTGAYDACMAGCGKKDNACINSCSHYLPK